MRVKDDAAFEALKKPRQHRDVRPIATEHQVQVSFFDWWRIQCVSYKIEERLCFAIKNDSIHTPAGRIYRWREGVQPGVPDVMLAVARGNWHGLFIEFKKEGRGMSEAQVSLAHALIGESYYVVTIDNVDDAIKLVQRYLAGERP